MNPTLRSNLRYVIEDWRFKMPPTQTYFFKKKKSHLFICKFSADCYFLGFDGKLWKLHCNPYNTQGKNRKEWFSITEKPVMRLYWFPCLAGHLGLSELTHREFRLGCSICVGEACFRDQVCDGWLENITHLLIKLQRWIRRKQRAGRVRSALLMALHPRLGALSPLAELGPDILFQGIFAHTQRIQA